MKITATVANSVDRHDVVVATNNNEQRLTIAPRPRGGSTINGGEMLAGIQKSLRNGVPVTFIVVRE